MTVPTLFTLGGRQDDAEILALLRRWIEGQRGMRVVQEKPRPDRTKRVVVAGLI